MDGEWAKFVSGRVRVKNHRHNRQCFFGGAGLVLGFHEDIKDPQMTKVCVYCWWLKSGVHQLRLVVSPIIQRVSYIPGGARFQPSTVSLAEPFLKRPIIKLSATYIYRSLSGHYHAQAHRTRWSWNWIITPGRIEIKNVWNNHYRRWAPASCNL